MRSLAVVTVAPLMVAMTLVEVIVAIRVRAAIANPLIDVQQGMSSAGMPRVEAVTLLVAISLVVVATLLGVMIEVEAAILLVVMKPEAVATLTVASEKLPRNLAPAMSRCC